MKFLLIVLISLSMLTSCEKVFFNCDIYVETFFQEASKDELEEVPYFKGYILFADTADYHVLNYNDAKDGIFTNRVTGEKQNSSFIAVNVEEQNLLFYEDISEVNTILLVVDEKSQSYAYKYQEVVENLPEIEIEFNLPFWKFEESKEFVENSWIYKRDEKKEPEPEPEPKQ